MDDHKIKILFTTLQKGSFNKAAEALNCTQSAVTQAMNSMEQELGIKILNRSHSGIHLTPEGQELLPALSAVETALSGLSSEAKRISEGRANPLRIGVFSSISTSWLPQAITRFKEDHPFASFSIHIGTNSLNQLLLNGELDIALTDSYRCKSFRFHPLVDDPYYATFPSWFLEEVPESISMHELTKYPFLMATQNALSDILPSTPKDCIYVDCDSDSTLLSMVESGLGATAIPELCLTNVPKGVTIVPIKPEIKRTLGIALPNFPIPIAREFSNFLIRNFTQLQK